MAFPADWETPGPSVCCHAKFQCNHCSFHAQINHSKWLLTPSFKPSKQLTMFRRGFQACQWKTKTPRRPLLRYWMRVGKRISKTTQKTKPVVDILLPTRPEEISKMKQKSMKLWWISVWLPNWKLENLEQQSMPKTNMFRCRGFNDRLDPCHKATLNEEKPFKDSFFFFLRRCDIQWDIYYSGQCCQ